MRKGVGVLLTLGSTILFFAVKNRLHLRAPVEAPIDLTPKEGKCGMVRQPSKVELRWLSEDQVHWIIANNTAENSPCDRRVPVCLKNWRWHGVPAPAPVTLLEGQRFCRDVGRHAPMRIPAKVSKFALPGTYTYEVHIDDKLALDPMVEIVP